MACHADLNSQAKASLPFSCRYFGEKRRGMTHMTHMTHFLKFSGNVSQGDSLLEGGNGWILHFR